MIKSLLLKNFQSHRNSYFEFSPHVTAIVGHNNQGKSAIFRALVKVLRNDPKGDVFITDTPVKEIECQITLETDRGKILRQIRSDSSSEANMYIVNDVDKYVKFGNEIPVEVKAVFGVSDIQKFGDETVDLNFQHQLDDRFLVTGRGVSSIRGKVLGKTTGVDDAQRALQLAVSDFNELNRELKKSTKEVKDTELALENYATLDAQIATVGKLQEAYDECVLAQLRIDQLKSLYTKLKTCVDEARKANQNLSTLIAVDKYISKLAEASLLQKEASVYRQLESIGNKLRSKEKTVADIATVDFVAVETVVRKLKVLKALQSIHHRVAAIKGLQELVIPDFSTINNYVQQLYTLSASAKKIKESARSLDAAENRIQIDCKDLDAVNTRIVEVKSAIAQVGCDFTFTFSDAEKVVLKELYRQFSIEDNDENINWFTKGFEAGRAYSEYKQLVN